jgi:hypothetical protein
MKNIFLTVAPPLAKPPPTCPHKCGQAGGAVIQKAFIRTAPAKAIKRASRTGLLQGRLIDDNSLDTR